ncbi:MAG: lytic murein transglycosylase B [Pseudomonadota bacterium]
MALTWNFRRILAMGLRIGVVLLIASVALQGSARANYAERQEVKDYVATLAQEHGFDEGELLKLFSVAEKQERILESIARPAERTLEWHEYRRIFIKEPRISQGVEFWQENAETLAAAEERYGVPPEYVVAILGVETRYGRITGNYRVLDALTTLAFDYPPRSKFFTKELTEYLLLTREEGRDPTDFFGSYAGAMGYGQFIPSSYRAYAVDFDADGARDIWSNRVDAIGSVANYFSRHGWRRGEPVAFRVTVDGDAADALANESLKPKRTLGELKALGVRLPASAPALADDAEANLYRMMLEEGPEYWLALKNFYVITRYNHSRLYALAVHQLAGEIVLARARGQETAAE